MRRRGAFAALGFVAFFAGCSGGTVVVSGPDGEGKIAVQSDAPPVDARVGEKGVERAPTATPGQPTPIYPVETPPPPPTRTPR